MSVTTVVCELCGHPMPPGEEMFRYHGYSGPCPEPMAGRDIADLVNEVVRLRSLGGPHLLPPEPGGRVVTPSKDALRARMQELGLPFVEPELGSPPLRLFGVPVSLDPRASRVEWVP